MALRTSKLSKNCASRGLVGPFRRAARAEKGPPGLQGGGGGGRPRRPPLATCLLFFDIEAAYDTVLRPVILRKLFKYGIRGCMGLFIQNFLSHRSFRVRVGNHLSRTFVQENGVPQGGVLSVALFAVVINDIGDELPAAVGRSLFVDDLAIWYAATSPRLMSRQLQLAVTRLER